jgi:hypothetical protein
MTTAQKLQLMIYPAFGQCGNDAPHVFESTREPPPDHARCVCGACTWRQAVEAAYARRSAEMQGQASPLAVPLLLPGL